MTVQYSLQPQIPQVNTFGQLPNQSINSIMSGFGQNQNAVNPMTGLRFEDPTGMLSGGSAGLGIPTTGDIGKSVASQNWGQTPQVAGSGFGINMPTFALGLQGLNSLGSLYMGSKSLDLANKQFESAQNFANINLANQTKSYNDTLENKIKRIGSFNGTSAADTAAEYERRKLTGKA